jgi:hypothetical protein
MRYRGAVGRYPALVNGAAAHELDLRSFRVQHAKQMLAFRVHSTRAAGCAGHGAAGKRGSDIQGLERGKDTGFNATPVSNERLAKKRVGDTRDSFLWCRRKGGTRRH